LTDLKTYVNQLRQIGETEHAETVYETCLLKDGIANKLPGIVTRCI